MNRYSTTSKRVLRARLVLPVTRPVMEDGAVITLGKRILAVQPWRNLSSEEKRRTVDLGDVLLLPGLVNAHCHLDYTDLAGHFPPPKVFTDWLKAITEEKAGWDVADYAESWSRGAQMLLRTGTTTVGDIEAVPQLLPKIWAGTPLRIFSFFEMIGLNRHRPPALVLQEVLNLLPGMRHHRNRCGLSPHAPYSTVPDLLKRTAKVARQHRYPVTVHVAESALEFQMFRHGSGNMFDWMERSGRDMADCGSCSPIAHLERCGILRNNLLAIHVNYLARNDAPALARRGVHVVHCPRSHYYFRHERFPWKRLQRAGVNLCLGTDSLASVCKNRSQNIELSMLDEMRTLATQEPWLSPRKILRFATVNGARALGMPGKLGELSPGAFADLITIPFPGKPAKAHEAVLNHRGPVSASMIEGRWAIAPN